MTPNQISKVSRQPDANLPKTEVKKMSGLRRTFGTIAILSISYPVMASEPSISPVSAAAESSAVSENNSPTAKADFVELNSASRAFNVLANDVDTDGDPLVLVEANAELGAVVFTPQGLMAYAQEAGQTRADVVTYTISDGRGGFSKGVVKISVR